MNTSKKTSKEEYDKWHRDPSNWKWGIFYYNKLDKRILPPKRIKAFGWTINFANPYSVLINALIITIALCIPMLLLYCSTHS
jgi:uncharacterized membrane protein